jgi:hypothetical protein
MPGFTDDLYPIPKVTISALLYGFGETRVGLLALLTFIVPLGGRSGGVVMAKSAGHDVTFRSSPTVFADTPMPGSTSTCIRSGQPLRSVWSATTLFTLYRIRAPSLPGPTAGNRLQPSPAGQATKKIFAPRLVHQPVTSLLLHSRPRLLPSGRIRAGDGRESYRVRRTPPPLRGHDHHSSSSVICHATDQLRD